MDKTVSISTIAYDGYNLETALRQISQIGGSYVELDAIEGLFEHIELQHLEDSTFEKRTGTMMRRFHLSSIAFSAHMDLSKEEAVPLFEKKMRFAKSLDAKIINTFSGPLKRINTFYKNIKSIDKLAKSMGLMVALETHGEILAQFFNQKGEKINCDLYKRIVAFPIEDLRQMQNVIGLAGGKAKVQAILGAIRGRFIKILITDEGTVKDLLILEGKVR